MIPNTIQAAINSSSGDTVFIGKGEVLIDVPMILKSNIHISGSGVDSTILKANSDIGYIFLSNPSTPISDVIIENMTLDMDDFATTSGIQIFGPATNITIRNVKFINTIGSWQLLIGNAEGTPADPGTKASNLVHVSRNIKIDGCEFGSHQISTLEQVIVVNAIGVDINNNVFYANSGVNAFDLAVYAFCENVSITKNHFRDLEKGGFYIQQCDHITAHDNSFVNATEVDVRCIDLVNVTDVDIFGNQTNMSYLPGSGSIFVEVRDAGSPWESGNYIGPNTASDGINVHHNNIDGCYVGFEAGRTLDEVHGAKNIKIHNNIIRNSDGVPVLIGNGNNVSMSDIEVYDNTINDFKQNDFGAISINGKSGTPITNIKIMGNKIPQSGQSGSDGYGMYLEYVENIIITGNDVSGKGNRESIALFNDGYSIIHNNNVYEFGIASSAKSIDIQNNMGVSVLKDIVTRRMKNTHGVTVTPGDIVRLKPVGAGDEVTMTNTQADNLIFGVVNDTIDNNEYGPILVLGKTSQLKVNGVIDIAVGDYITTYSVEGVGRKAATGEIAIAIALESYTNDDSDGVIDALVIPPRQI